MSLILSLPNLRVRACIVTKAPRSSAIQISAAQKIGCVKPQIAWRWAEAAPAPAKRRLGHGLEIPEHEGCRDRDRGVPDDVVHEKRIHERKQIH
jgi:hypothetical protein